MQRAALTDTQRPSAVQLQAHQACSEDPLPAYFVGQHTEGYGQEDTRYCVEHLLPTKYHSHLLLHRVCLAQLLGYRPIFADDRGVTRSILAQGYVGLKYACTRGFAEEGAHVDDGYERESEDHHDHPWLRLRWSWLVEKRKSFFIT